MFDTLSTRFDGIFKRLRGKGRLTADDVEEVLREIRTALLEADVNVGVVRTSSLASVRQRSAPSCPRRSIPASRSSRSSTPRWSTSSVARRSRSTYASKPPTVVLMAGLQGSGKTTNSAKLARWFKSQGRQPLLVGADLQRPAAVEQLRTLGRQIDVPVFSEPGDPVTTAERGLAEARRLGKDVLIVDTAGRLAIDADMMEQVRQISGVLQSRLHVPRHRCDDGSGRGVRRRGVPPDAGHRRRSSCRSSTATHRGGAALSVKEVIGRPIAFASTGEKLDAFEQFHPDRMASRILGMGDVLTLIEQAEQAFEKDQAEEAATKLLEGQFTLDDFLEQMQALKKMGPLGGLLGMMPGMPKELKNAEIGDDALKPIEAIIRSMTPEERRRPSSSTAAVGRASPRAAAPRPVTSTVW
jgi:signal recognition particle subunit SRP54